MPAYLILLFLTCFVFVHLIDINVDRYKNIIKRRNLKI
jgi:hypothetical protein